MPKAKKDSRDDELEELKRKLDAVMELVREQGTPRPPAAPREVMGTFSVRLPLEAMTELQAKYPNLNRSEALREAIKVAIGRK